MNDTGGVRLGHGFARLQDPIGGGRGPHGPVVREHLREIVPFEVLHHHIRRARIELADVEHASHVLALELHRRARFAKEALNGLLVVERLVANELDGDHLVELLVARRDDDPHPSGAEDTLDPVLAGEQIALAHGGGAGTDHYQEK